MSLILDALRKSEAERRRGQLPALTLELPPAPARRAPARTWWLALPTALVLAASAHLLTREAPDAPAVVDATAKDRVAMPHAPPGVEVAPPPVVVRGPPVPANPAPATQATQATPATPAPPPETGPTVAAPQEFAAAGDTPPVLALADLTPTERQALPALKLSMHMWSPDPAQRFAIVDGQRIVEGDRIGGAVVERIEPDGVVLAADGRLVRVPLP